MSTHDDAFKAQRVTSSLVNPNHCSSSFALMPFARTIAVCKAAATAAAAATVAAEQRIKIVEITVQLIHTTLIIQ